MRCLNILARKFQFGVTSAGPMLDRDSLPLSLAAPRERRRSHRARTVPAALPHAQLLRCRPMGARWAASFMGATGSFHGRRL